MSIKQNAPPDYYFFALCGLPRRNVDSGTVIHPIRTIPIRMSTNISVYARNEPAADKGTPMSAETAP